MGVLDDDLVISSDLQLRLDGFPKSSQREPDDPGVVAVYWIDAGESRCMAIDRYDRIADNLAAVAATLDAMRAIERHGGAEILNRAFTGFTALPSSAESWWGILGVEPNARRIEIDSAYRRRRSETTQTGPAATPRYSTRCRRPTSRQSGAPHDQSQRAGGAGVAGAHS